MREKPYTNYVHQQGTEYGPLGLWQPPINDFSKKVLKPQKAMPAAIVILKRKI